MFSFISTTREYFVNCKMELKCMQVREMPDEQLNSNYKQGKNPGHLPGHAGLLLSNQ